MNVSVGGRRLAAPVPLSGALISLSACLAACAPVDGTGSHDAGMGEPARVSFEWETHEVDGLVAGWGSVFTPSAPRTGFLLGGVDGTEGPVTGRILELSAGDDVSATAAADLTTPRYCGCALYDENREELVAIGGRTFSAEMRDAVVVDAAGAASSVGDVGPGAAPIGCAAIFFPALDRGYVFGGRGQASGMSDVTWRYDPSTRSFAALDASGPSARYDAAIKRLDDEQAVLVGGMGAGPFGAVFPSDVWMFDATSEAWTALAVSGPTPPGRRVPWVALGPDDDTLLMGFGSDAPDGSSALGDLWRLSLAAATWQELSVQVPDDVIAPLPRGFTPWLPGPEGSAGLLFGGYDGASVIPDTPLALFPPAELAGEWR